MCFLNIFTVKKSNQNLPNKINTNINSNTNTNLNLNLDSTKKLNLNGYKGNFYVKSVYDGDTITILLPISLSLYNFIDSKQIELTSFNNPTNTIELFESRLRLYGIDTPEIKPLKNLPNREEHIKKAKEAKEFLSNLILNKIITIEFLENDKYGRPLANIFINELNINKLMIEKGFAKEYDGGTKDTNF